MKKLSSLSLLIKPASSLCNLRCKYCFYADESENRQQKCYGLMSFETADRLIEYAVEAVSGKGTVSIGFQGGEPTLIGLDFFRHFIEEEKKYPEVRFIHSIQTNGYALNEEWAAFLAENVFLTGISIDGYKEVHDTNRITSEGEGSFERVAGNHRILKKHNVETNALCVITGQAAKKPHRVFNRLKQMGFDFIQFIACLDPLGNERGKEPYSLVPEDYGSFLCAVFDDWYADWKNGSYISIRQFDDYVHLLTGIQPSSCAATGKCGVYLVVEADGSLYPCDFYVLDEWNIGNINDSSILQAIESPKALSFFSDNGKRPDSCGTCTWLPLCHGGCKRDISFTDSIPENYYCSAFRFFFEYASERLMEIARAELREMRKTGR